MLTVTPDIVPPTVVQAVNLGTTNVLVTYSEVVEAASATNIANYVFTNGLAIFSATLSPDNRTVTLITDPVVFGSNYLLVINGVRDQAAAPNTITANTMAAMIATPYTPAEVGGATPTGSGVAVA